MGIIRRLREWREEQDGTLTGPAIDAESAAIDKLTSDLDANGQNINNAGAFEAGLVNTERVDYTGLTDGQTLILSAVDDGDVQAVDTVQLTSGVGTSSVEVATYAPLATKGRTGDFRLQGSDGSGSRYLDSVQIMDGTGAVQTEVLFERGSPASRSYSVSGTDLELAMGSDTYDIIAKGEVLRSV